MHVGNRFQLYYMRKMPTVNFLHAARVQHDTDASSNGLRRQISSESASNDSIGTVVSADLAPVNTEGSILSLGNKCHLLSQVKVYILSAVAALDLNEGDIDMLRPQTALVAENGTIHMKTGSSF